MNVDVNWLGVLVASLSGMVVGSVWYSKGVFGVVWAKLAKVDLDSEKTKKSAPRAIAIAVLMSVLTAYILAHVAALSKSYFGVSPLEAGLSTAFWLWLGVSATTVFTHDIFEQRPLKLSLLTVGNQLATMMLMGLVIGLFGGF